MRDMRPRTASWLVSSPSRPSLSSGVDEVHVAPGGRRATAHVTRTAPPPTSRHKMGGGRLGLILGVLIRCRRGGRGGCSPMAQIAAILLRKAARGSGVHFERKVRPFTNRPADVAKGGVRRMPGHTELPKLGLRPVERGKTHDVGESCADGSGRGRGTREQRGRLRKIGPAPPTARPIGESLIFAARDALQVLGEPGEIAQNTFRRREKVHRLTVLRTLHPTPNNEGGVTAVGEELCPLHVLHPNRKPSAKKEGAGEETYDRIL
eukprot:scaffold5734_cov90-Isochrysis_galbana.AAC.1